MKLLLSAKPNEPSLIPSLPGGWCVRVWQDGGRKGEGKGKRERDRKRGKENAQLSSCKHLGSLYGSVYCLR